MDSLNKILTTQLNTPSTVEATQDMASQINALTNKEIFSNEKLKELVTSLPEMMDELLKMLENISGPTSNYAAKSLSADIQNRLNQVKSHISPSEDPIKTDIASSAKAQLGADNQENIQSNLELSSQPAESTLIDDILDLPINENTQNLVNTSNNTNIISDSPDTPPPIPGNEDTSLLQEVIDTTESLTSDILTETVPSVLDTVEELGDSLLGENSLIEDLTGNLNLDNLSETLDPIFSSIDNLTDSLGLDELSNTLENGVESLIDPLENFLDNNGILSPVVDPVLDNVSNIADTLLNDELEPLAHLIDDVNDSAQMIVDDLEELDLPGLVEPVSDIINDPISNVEDLFGSIDEISITDPTSILDSVDDISDTLLNESLEPLAHGVDDLTDILDPVVDDISLSDPTYILDGVDDMIDSTIDPLAHLVEDVSEQPITSILDELGADHLVENTLNELTDDLSSQGDGLLSQIVDPILDISDDLTDNLLGDDLSQPLDEITDIGEDAIDFIEEGVGDLDIPIVSDLLAPPDTDNDSDLLDSLPILGGGGGGFGGLFS